MLDLHALVQQARSDAVMHEMGGDMSGICDNCQHRDECDSQPDGAAVVACPRYQRRPRNGDRPGNTRVEPVPMDRQGILDDGIHTACDVCGQGAQMVMEF